MNIDERLNQAVALELGKAMLGAINGQILGQALHEAQAQNATLMERIKTLETQLETRLPADK